MRRLVLGLLLLLSASACDAGAGRPQEPVWDKQACAHCAMLLTDREHGGQLVTRDGERLHFDDLGCLIAWTLEHRESTARRWVRTADTRAWLAPEDAGFEPRERTPMGFGFVAVARPTALEWAEVEAAVRATLGRE